MVITSFRLPKILAISAVLFFHLFGNGQITVPAFSCSQVENFDNSNPWTFGGTNSSWTWANPDKLDVPDDITIGGKCLILGGNTATSTYNQNEESWAESPSYNLTAVDNPYITFNFYWSNEGSTTFDEIWMEYSLNNGSTWTDLATPVGSGTCYDQNWYNYPDNWGGNVGGCFPGLGGPSGWVLVRKCINSLANEPNVKFRFRISTGSTCQNYGATVDEFKICDANIVAQASYQCTQSPLEIEFFDESYDCPTNWYWLFGDGDSSDVSNPIHTYASPGVYTVTLVVATNTSVTSGCGGPYQDSYNFDVEVIGVSINNPVHVSCNGFTDGEAAAMVVGALPGAVYNWLPAPPLGQGTTTASNLAAGTYVLDVIGANTTCIASSTVIITGPTAISATYSSSDASCQNACDGTLSANISGGEAPYTVIWSPGNLNGASQINVCPNIFDISIVDNSGCILDELTVLEVSAPPIPEIFNVTDVAVCSGDQIDLDNFQTSLGVTTISWTVIGAIDIGFGISGSGNIPNFAAIGGPITVAVEVIPEINANCIGQADTFNITIAPIPNPDFSFEAEGNCEPLSVLFDVVNPTPNSIYTWNFGTSENRVGSPIIYEFQSGLYSVTLTEVTENNCINTIVKADVIAVTSKPKADFTFSPSYYEEQGSEVVCTNLSINATEYIWYVNATDLISANENPVFNLKSDGKGFFEIVLIATNNGGCTDSSNRFIKIREPEIIYVPNAFTPFTGNINNTFKPIIQSGVDIYNYEFSVYNRWGEIVFLSKNPLNGWNGTLVNGEKVQAGIYTYSIRYNNLYFDNPKLKTGFVTLIY